MSVEEIARLLSLEDADAVGELFAAARAEKLRCCGVGIAVRGLVEAGNVCAKDCFYCGIRRSNRCLGRYQLSSDEIFAAAEEAKKLGYASLVIQSGELESNEHSDFIESVLLRLKPLDLGITLSLGEQEEAVYARWQHAGASRYLLRIETSNRELYAKLHPSTHSWERRVECLRALRRTGYQVGTGVMCGLPSQTVRDLAEDVKFFEELDVDMLGMGPYIPHPDTPMFNHEYSAAEREQALMTGLKLIAVSRLELHDVNIAASTALQALAPDGRERGILAGANVIMPNVTDTRFRRGYQLYEGKPSLDENAEGIRLSLDEALAGIGEHLLYGRRGDSRHFLSGRNAEPSIVR